MTGPAVSVEVQGIPATMSDGRFTAEVTLKEGNNTVTAVARNADGIASTASIQVTLDTDPPRVVIDSPPDGFVTNTGSITVAGMINDTVVGTVNGQQATVDVNSIAADVSNRSFLAVDVPLIPGENTITARGVDRAGNPASASITVTFEEIVGESLITLVSGNNQSGQAGSELAEPLVVLLTDERGNPASNATVIFKVIENSGTLSASPEEVRSVAVVTDDKGLGQVHWTLGTRAGAGNNVVEAAAVDFTGMAIFTANALPTPADKINVDAGNNQTGVVGQPLAKPFVAVVTDAGHNRLHNVRVTFTVTEGGGDFGGQSTLDLFTDSDGRALAVLTLGPEEGFDNNIVEADFPGNPGFPARFTTTGQIPADPSKTRVSGVVLDNTDNPIPGVTMRIDGTNLAVQTDEQGLFEIRPAPVGHVVLLAEGATARRPGAWPTLEFDLVTVAGRDNTIGMPIYLLPLDLPNGLRVDEDNGGVLTLPEVPGFSLEIAPGSATFPEGGKSGLVSVTLVHADKIPMVPNFGQQPRFVVTIQPAGVRFDPPAPITIPNVDSLAPGKVTEMYSFDHDLGQFISIGTGTVSEDGTIIASDPGVGILKGGWHCGGDPATTGSAESAHVEITSAKEVTLDVGSTTRVTADGGPSPGSYNWDSSDETRVELVGSTDGSRVTIRRLKPGGVTITVTYTCQSGAKASDSMKVTGLTADLDIDGVADDDEETEGGIVGLNDDDDDTSGEPDKDESGPIDEEDDLKEITLSVEPADEDGEVKLEATSGASNIRVWDGKTKKTEVKLPKTYADPSEVPPSLWVEGLEVSDGARDVELTLTYTVDSVSAEDKVSFTVVGVEFVDDTDEVLDLATDFSHPYPVVILDDVSMSDLAIGGNVANITIFGTVVDAIADIAPDHRADITEVFIEYNAGPTFGLVSVAFVGAGESSGVPGLSSQADAPGDDFIVSVPVPVTRDDSEPTSSLRPYAFRGTFSATVQVPLSAGAIEVGVRADNFIGNSGFDSFSIDVQEDGFEFDVLSRLPIPDGGVSSGQISGVTNHDSTGFGLVNAIRVHITDPSVDQSNLSDFSVEFFGAETDLKIEDGQLQAEHPFLAMARDFPGDIPNLHDIISRGGRTTLVYRGIEREFNWGYTAASPATEFHYVEGTTADHAVRNSVFRDWKPRGAGDVTVQRRVPGSWIPPRSAKWEDDSTITVTGLVSELAAADGEEPGVVVKLRLGNGASDLSEKRLRFTLYYTGPFGTGEKKKESEFLGRFKAEQLLKVIIVGVDGLAYESILGLLDDADPDVAPTFKKVFGDAANRGSVALLSPALSALPTVTWNNWPGIFSGQPPRDHGTIGNSFFERERDPPVEPFASSGKVGITNQPGREAVAGGLNNRARLNAGSLYDNVATAAGTKIDVWSVHMWYNRHSDKSVNMHAEYFGSDPRYLGHDAGAATALDTASGGDAARRFGSHRKTLDILTVYFPGPDNLAHANGAPPNLPEVGTPLTAIRNHARDVTDGQLKRIVDAVEDLGYQNATLFVLVADHGLHAFHNTPNFNLTLDGGLDALFTAAGAEVWRGGVFEKIRSQSLVYAPNGGQAHIYLRNSFRLWNQPPTKDDIQRVARALYIESIAGAGFSRCTSTQSPETHACYAALSPVLAPKANTASSLGIDDGALGNPPAIFVRVSGTDCHDDGDNSVNHFTQDFRWVRSVDPATGRIQCDSLAAFIRARVTNNPAFDWPDFVARMDEMNDKNPDGSRTGDIVIFTDGRAGYLTVNQGDALDGWHGGPTISESRVPLMFNIPGSVVNKDFINNSIPSGTLRNWQLSEVLVNIYTRLKSP